MPEQSEPSRWYVHPLRVRYQETDQMGVVFHGNYVTWFEIGRTELIRTAGVDYKSIEREGLLLPVVDLQCRFETPARYDDKVIVCTRVSEFSPVRLAFESQIRRVDDEHWRADIYETERQLPGAKLVSGGTRHVWVNDRFRPARLDKVMPQLYELLHSIALK
ncbi:thioesterase family protein [Paenibacillus sp. NEAU-GSW1]|uniref:acyl-CoA thioesterase n=1 Tax=Paenibacillus sp. NEAU-GSW1 TaxID=2682486 RepID=UPI0012E10A37|nr:thioesterase family protein [Paenibacillus sp. NEAU-GSW1]MUT64469.1 YbgC/FadM family acyl-CoA thioesterase [Paenibacillus sp. NEAU-GSW1]